MTGQGSGSGTGRRPGLLTLEQLRVEVRTGAVDTVLIAFTDMQGRLAGKRLSAGFFMNEVAEKHAEGCNYLLAVDVDMNTVPGYAMSSWERGYGDFTLVPDLDTQLRAHRGALGSRQPQLRDAAGRARPRAPGGEPGPRR